MQSCCMDGSTGQHNRIKQAAQALAAGSFIVMYDGDEREGEADLIFHASFADAAKVERMRKDAGGLICIALGSDEAKKLRVPFYTDVLRKAGLGAVACRKTAYGDEPAFSISVNHKEVYTGITDNDRALTIKKIEETVRSEKSNRLLAADFHSPGHVFLLISRGLKNRRGHTELATEIARLAGMSEAVVLCEMLGKGKALSKNDAVEYAKRNRFVFIEGKEISSEVSSELTGL